MTKRYLPLLFLFSLFIWIFSVTQVPVQTPYSFDQGKWNQSHIDTLFHLFESYGVSKGSIQTEHNQSGSFNRSVYKITVRNQFPEVNFIYDLKKILKEYELKITGFELRKEHQVNYHISDGSSILATVQFKRRTVLSDQKIIHLLSFVNSSEDLEMIAELNHKRILITPILTYHHNNQIKPLLDRVKREKLVYGIRVPDDVSNLYLSPRLSQEENEKRFQKLLVEYPESKVWIIDGSITLKKQKLLVYNRDSLSELSDNDQFTSTENKVIKTITAKRLKSDELKSWLMTLKKRGWIIGYEI